MKLLIMLMFLVSCGDQGGGDSSDQVIIDPYLNVDKKEEVVVIPGSKIEDNPYIFDMNLYHEKKALMDKVLADATHLYDLNIGDDLDTLTGPLKKAWNGLSRFSFTTNRYFPGEENHYIASGSFILTNPDSIFANDYTYQYFVSTDSNRVVVRIENTGFNLYDLESVLTENLEIWLDKCSEKEFAAYNCEKGNHLNLEF